MTRLSQRRRNPAPTSEAFKRWFGKSKVVDALGQPWVVYHGSTDPDIEVFSSSPYRHFPAFFFTSDDYVAGGYGEEIYSVYLRIERPLVVDAAGADWASIPKTTVKMRGWAAQDKKAAQEFMEDNSKGRFISTDVIGALAQALGFDGAIIQNVVDAADEEYEVPSTVYVVFDPHQIKSARENAGTFDPDDPSIYRNPRRNGRSASTAERTDPDLWEAVKREVTAGSKGGLPGQWSARKAQLAVLLYKQRGGGYWGEKSPTNSLAKWTREKWRTKSGRPSLETGERYLPSRAIAALTDAEYRATTRAKRAGMRKGQQFVPQPEDVALKVRAYRRNPVQDFRAEDAALWGTYGAAETIFTKLAKTQFKERTRGVFEPPQGSPKEDLRGMTRRVLRGLGIRPRARAYSIDWLSSKNRNKGTGSRVVREIEQTLRNEGEEVVFLVSGWVEHGAPHSRGFWERMGYREVPGNYGHLFAEKNEEEWWRDDYEGSENDRIMYKVLGRTNPARRVGKNRR